MEEEIKRLKHENTYLHRKINELWEKASDYAFDHIEEHTRENAFLDYNVCNNSECLNNDTNVDWFAEIYYCLDCENAVKKRKEAEAEAEAAEAAEAEARRKREEEIRQQKEAEKRNILRKEAEEIQIRQEKEIPDEISIEAFNTAAQFGLQIRPKKRRKHK